MTKSFRDWLAEGEAIYTDSLKEYQTIESEITELEVRLADKKGELNQIALMIGKPAVEGPKRVSAQIIEQAPPGTMGSVTRALTGRGLVARAPQA